jgi:hypothetical protein
VSGLMRSQDDASLGHFVLVRFVTICPHFLGRTIHPHFDPGTHNSGTQRQGTVIIMQGFFPAIFKYKSFPRQEAWSRPSSRLSLRT